MTIKRYGGRYWAVYDASGTLVCICLYKKGAQEVVRRLTSQEQARYPPRATGKELHAFLSLWPSRMAYKPLDTSHDLCPIGW
jgi:hypothetical protein